MLKRHVLVVSLVLGMVVVLLYQEISQKHDESSLRAMTSLSIVSHQSSQESKDTKSGETISSKAKLSNFLRKVQSGNSGECEPKFNIMYLKTHKCASSTMQNILFRYACTHNQKHQLIACGQPSHKKEEEEEEESESFPVIVDDDAIGRVGKEAIPNSHNESTDDHPIIVAVPSHGIYVGNPQKFNAKMLQKPEWLLPPSGLVNIFGLHTRMDSYQLQKVLHPGSLWITIVRNPVQLYPSCFTYFKINIAVKSSLEEFLKRPLDQMKKAPRYSNRFGANQMTFDLGYGPETFYNDDKIDDMIEELEDTFDLILIAERMDESLILLGHALCWSLDDLVSFSKNVRSQRTSLTPEEERKLEELNYSDMRLYQHFSRQFELLTQLYGKNKLEEEVKALQAKRQEVQEYCVKEVVQGHDEKASIKEYSGSVFGFLLRHPEDPTCMALAWNSRQYIDYFRGFMKRRFHKLSDGKQ